jgi:hypothetical protein
VAAALLAPLGGCASAPAAPDPGAGVPVPTAPTGPTAGQRAASAVEGMLMGAIIGGQVGPIGAAVGGVTLLLYSAITGQVPFQGPGMGGGHGGLPPGEIDREDEIEQQIEAEIARQDSLEEEIERELRRQEELLRQIERDDALRQAGTAPAKAPSQEELVAHADPREAPRAPAERDLPLSIFDEQQRTIRKGQWGNERELEVLQRSLDADRDGAPEEVRYHDARSGVILRKENDEDYDGAVDTWSLYENGVLVAIERDHGGDGEPDDFERYGPDGRMVAREVDRNQDGSRDAFYRFAGGSLVEERHLEGDDVKRVVHYEARRLVRSEEDTSGDGRLDTWTYFRVAGDQEVVDRVERDTSGDGRADVFESYEQVAGQPTLKQRDEDKNGDGQVDVTSIYENGKLKERQINDPALLPL